MIKIFASRSIRDGGAQTLSDSQLLALCGESRAQGLRSVVHAHSAESMRAAALAGCTQIEHGVFATASADCAGVLLQPATTMKPISAAPATAAVTL